MSNHLTSLAYKADVGSLLRKSVLVMLADKASDDGSGIWASKQTMADELCCSKQAILNTLRQFVDEGLLDETGRRKNRNGFTITYTLNVEALEGLPRVKRWASNQSTGLTSQPGGPVNGIDETSQPGGPEPSFNPPSTPVISNEITSPPAKSDLKAEHVIETWNAVADQHGLAKAKMTPERRKKINTFIRRHPFEDIAEAFSRIPATPFLLGENDRGWKANLDFFLQPASFTKIIEGTYGQ